MATKNRQRLADRDRARRWAEIAHRARVEALRELAEGIEAGA